MANSNNPKIVELEKGWGEEIKVKALDVLEKMLNEGIDKKVREPKRERAQEREKREL